MSFIPLEDLEVFKMSMEIGDEVWHIVATWDSFQKNTIGLQICRSSDSIAANISEGYGRYFYKENRNFCFYARGSLLETKTWLTKSHSRKLIDLDSYNRLMDKLASCHRLLNKYIKSIGKTGKLPPPDDPMTNDQ